ncbi:hypothetical protein C7B19_25865 [Escherichia coli]|nr:hypothetical protein C7B19_25865 [Escherichia coli]
MGYDTKVLKNVFFWRFHVGPFTDVMHEKTMSYAREVPTRFFQKNFHKQRNSAPLPPRGEAPRRKDP